MKALHLLAFALQVSSSPAEPTIPSILPVPCPIKDAGTYHLATGTWTRPASLGAGSWTVYNNNVATPFFLSLEGIGVIVNEGRLPGTNDPNLPNAQCDAYRINGFQIAYVTSEVTAATDFEFRFLEQYDPCTDPELAASPLARFHLVGVLPGSPTCGEFSAWTVTIDLSGTTSTFVMRAEGEGVFDDDSDLDSFGWSIQVHETGCGPGGPILGGGDPGCQSLPEGDGTYYQNFTIRESRGLGTFDMFWVENVGCFFGDCVITPFRSFHMQLYAERECP